MLRKNALLYADTFCLAQTAAFVTRGFCLSRGHPDRPTFFQRFRQQKAMCVRKAAGLPSKSQCLLRLAHVCTEFHNVAQHLPNAAQTQGRLPDIFQCLLRRSRFWPDLKLFVMTSSMSEERLEIPYSIIEMFIKKLRIPIGIKECRDKLQAVC